MHGRRNPFVAQEGLPVLIALVAIAIALIRYSDPVYAVLPALLFIVAFLIFRDPQREILSVALGVYSPVDGTVVETSIIEQGEAGAPAISVVIAIDSLGTYTARAPVEGSIKNLGKKVLSLQTDEGDDVTLRFTGYRFGFPPKALGRFGERFGQGQRCAYLRLTRTAEVQWPADGKLLSEAGQKVAAGIDLIGNVPSPR